ncbi:ABC transporter permease [Metabacillus fastidiosus]|uniref:ABC transporter permease n=1 Tax=Metabacillus fastidiosus TaxID=1458 RepID=UPI002E1D31D6|nr:ABC transporter permease [Metabacillus fastidiosus]
MLGKILGKDFQRKKSITFTLFIFIMLSALLVSSGSGMLIKLTSSINNLFTASDAPHFVQMHSGKIEKLEIEKFAAANKLVKNHQISEMVNIDGANVSLGSGNKSEAGSVMDISFVKQNRSFDFLLNLENEPVQVSRGQIGVPIYYMQRDHLKIGDKVIISDGNFHMEFKIAYFIRDALMNPSVVHSKRFLIHEADYETLKSTSSEIEYMIEFQLTHIDKLNEFTQSYQSAQLPDKGPTIDYHSFQVLNALTDGIIAAIIILVSLLLIIIASLCLRLTILATMEEDYKEIGVMKAIGIEPNYIKRIYMTKYIVTGAAASITGYLISLFIGPLFSANIMLYAGAASETILQYMIPVMAAVSIFLIVILFAQLILRRFNKITAVEALQAGSIGETKVNFLPLAKNKHLGVNIFLGLNDIFGRIKMFIFLFFIFVICSFTIIVPVNFLHTIQSPDFIAYMGIGKSDIRIDLQQSENTDARFNEVLNYIQNDADIRKFSPMITSRFKVWGSDGVLENINIETGDMSIFPLKYLQGRAPVKEKEIALSYLNGENFDKSVGDKFRLVIDSKGNEKELVISGIYQDITNGGRTAKAVLPENQENVLWYVVSLDAQPGVNIAEKMDEYTKAFHPAKVTHLDEYLMQTLGDTIEQLKKLTVLFIVIAVFVSILITFLFMQMLLAKDLSQIAVMRSLGFSLKDIQVQYIVKILLIMSIAVIIGTILSNTAGESVISFLWSFIGASDIQFIINPVSAYIICPLILMLAVTVTTILSLLSMNKSHNINME